MKAALTEGEQTQRRNKRLVSAAILWWESVRDAQSLSLYYTNRCAVM